MRFTTRYLPALALIGLAVPALASGEARAPGAIEAYDFGFRNTAGGGTSVTINAGETVTFNYPTGTGTGVHNVAFTANRPTSCTQTVGGSGQVPPLPPAAAPGLGGQLPVRYTGLVSVPVRATRQHDRHRRKSSALATPTPTVSPQRQRAPGDRRPRRPLSARRRVACSSRAISAVRPSAARSRSLAPAPA